jgi:hypothetical protein
MVLLLEGGCTVLGPWSLTRDRFNYTSAISDSWKDQMLVNLVMLRYGDPLVFVEVASIISQYQLAGQMSTLFSWSAPPAVNSQSVGGSAAYSERPTITYNLLAGHKFARSLMTPIPPAAVMSLIQAGYPSEFMLRLTVKAVNGIQNRSGAAMLGHNADPRFYELIRAMGRVQRSGAVGIRVQEEKKGEPTAVLVFSRDPDEAVEKDRRLIRELLGVNPQAVEFSMAFGMVPANDREIAILSRSLLDILNELSSGIEVPEIHVTEKRTYPTREEDVFEGQQIATLIRIHSGKHKPDDAFAAVQYRGWWYWIDDRDFVSKRIFGFIMFLFTLVEEPSKEGTPIVTIPTN